MIEETKPRWNNKRDNESNYQSQVAWRHLSSISISISLHLQLYLSVSLSTNANK